MSAKQDTEAFLKIASDFKLGELDTEQSHPLSQNLSQLVNEDLQEAIDVLKQVDLQALQLFQTKLEPLKRLSQAIKQTLASNKKVFLCGCGATGRLSLSLETFCREGMLGAQYADSVISFMAGGDNALIRSIEKFEDHPEFGERQLMELGFTEGDLLISSTEGGETPFVIGATEQACRVSQNAPWFLYCNPDAQLNALVARSRRVIENSKIHKVNLAVGPMGIAGSTRMQASTVLMEAIGLAFMNLETPDKIEGQADDFLQWVDTLDFSFLEPFILREAEIYKNGNSVLYQTDRFGMSVLTDTTERSPTFSLPCFEHTAFPDQAASLCYLEIKHTHTTDEAWHTLLHRAPRTFDWKGLDAPTNSEHLNGYDISSNAIEHRKQKLPHTRHHFFEIIEQGDKLCFRLDDIEHTISLKGKPLLFQHLLLKLLLNTHSTLLMGKLGRYEGNMMSYVKPSNNKLIDRAIRYVQTLFTQRTSRAIDYESVAHALFQQRERLAEGEPIVLKTLEALLLKNHSSY